MAARPPHRRRMGQTERLLRWVIGRGIRDGRVAAGWSQRELARRAGISAGMVAAVEAAAVNFSVGMAAALLDALGIAPTVELTAPHLMERQRQRDAVHARLIGYIASRLRRAGWLIETEVEVGEGRQRLWIDLLAIDRGSGLLMVIEVKTEIHDLGAVDRQLARYVASARSAARRLGWRPVETIGVLAVLETEQNEGILRFNRAYLENAYPYRAPLLNAIASGSATTPPGRGRALVMIDPLSRATTWLKRSKIDGRRSAQGGPTTRHVPGICSGPRMHDRRAGVKPATIPDKTALSSTEQSWPSPARTVARPATWDRAHAR